MKKYRMKKIEQAIRVERKEGMERYRIAEKRNGMPYETNVFSTNNSSDAYIRFANECDEFEGVSFILYKDNADILTSDEYRNVR